MATSSSPGARLGHRVSIRKVRHERYSWRATFVEAGKRRQKYFKTKAEAEEFQEEREEEALTHGVGATVSAAERAVVVETREELKGLRLTLREAVAFAMEHHRRAQASSTVAELVTEAIAKRKRAGRSQRHIADLRSKLGKFERVFGKRSVATITTQEVETWLHGLGVAPRSFNSYRIAVTMLFNDAVKARQITDNPAANVEAMSVGRSKYSALSPSEASALLTDADEAILPAITIGLFAGLRDSEIKRLDWSEVNLQGDDEMPHGYIWLAGENTKTNRHRQVPISANLRAWLLPHAKDSGSVWPESQQSGRKLHEAARLAAGFASPTIVEKAKKKGKTLRVWPNNAQRHSYASYHLAHHKDAGALALAMGSSVQMIYNNYRKLVSAADAKVFWSITPKTANEIAKKGIQGESAPTSTKTPS